MAGQGRVTRASPVQTAVHNCTRDEGRSFGFGNQVLIPSHCKLLRLNVVVVSVAETPGRRSRHARSREASASKPSMKCRKPIRRCQNRGVTLVWALSRRFSSQGSGRFSNATHVLFFRPPVSLFDLKARFFIPTRSSARPSRAGAVKVGHRTGLSTCFALARPYLDGFEHDGALGAVGMTIRGEPAFSGRGGSVAPQPCIR